MIRISKSINQAIPMPDLPGHGRETRSTTGLRSAAAFSVTAEDAGTAAQILRDTLVRMAVVPK